MRCRLCASSRKRIPHLQPGDRTERRQMLREQQRRVRLTGGDNDERVTKGEAVALFEVRCREEVRGVEGRDWPHAVRADEVARGTARHRRTDAAGEGRVELLEHLAAQHAGFVVPELSKHMFGDGALDLAVEVVRVDEDVGVDEDALGHHDPASPKPRRGEGGRPPRCQPWASHSRARRRAAWYSAPSPSNSSSFSTSKPLIEAPRSAAMTLILRTVSAGSFSVRFCVFTPEY